MYNYKIQKREIFTEDGLVMFTKIRDNAFKLISLAGCARMGEIIAGNTGDSWTMLACVDRLVETGEIREIKYGDCAGQNRIFIKPGQ